MVSSSSFSALDQLSPDPSQLERGELEEHALALWALLRVAETVHRAHDFDGLVEGAVEAIARYMRYPSVALFRLDRQAGVLHLLAARGFNEEARARARTLPVSGSLTGLAVQERAIVTSQDLQRDPRVEPATRQALSKDGFHEVACVPLFQGDDVIGALNLIYRHRPHLDESELQVLMALGQTIGMAMSARLAAEERARLEKEARRTQQIESLGLFAGGVAHDFNNILTGILGNLSLVQGIVREAELGEAERLLGESERACQRAAGLVKQLLTFSRGGAPLKRPTRDLATLVEEAARFATTGASVALVFRQQPIAGSVEIDAGQIMQVVHNLVLNAVQASPSGATLEVSVGPLDEPVGTVVPGRAAIVVQDHGAGIPPENLSHIFEPYFTTRSQGSGLGLATILSIVQQHDGKVSVTSTLGRGARFVVELPLAAADRAAGHEATDDSAATAPSLPEVAASFPGRRALVLDDDTMVRTLLARMLEKLGLEAHLTARGEETIAAYTAAREQARPFDLVILDLTVVGGLGGKDTLAILRQLDPDVRAIASSGYSDDPVLAHPERYGFGTILPKPYTRRALAEALGKMLAAS